MAQQLLDGADVVAVLQQVGGERMPKGVVRGWLGDPGAPDRLLHRPSKDGFVQVVPATLAGDAVHVHARGREDPLPSAGPAGVAAAFCRSWSDPDLEPLRVTQPMIGVGVR